MRFVLALCVLLAVANAMPEIPDPVSTLKTLDWSAPQRHVNTFHALSARVQRRDASDVCQRKYAAFILSDCFDAVRQAFSNDAATFNPIPFCQSNCSAAFSDVMAACDQSWSLNDTASGFAMITELMCLKDGEKWCFTTFRALQNAFQGPPNATTLDNFCGPCVRKVVNVIASYGGLGQEGVREARLALDLLCLKDGNQYCWVEFQSPQFQACFQGNGGNDMATTSCLDLMCSDCFAKIATAMWLYYGADTTEGRMFAVYRNFLCNKNPSGQYCYVLFEQFANQQQTRQDAQGQSGSAPTCAQLSQLSQSLGCCLGSVVGFLQAIDNTTSQQITTFVKDCGQTLPAACPRTGGKFQLAIHFSLTLPYDWAESHRADVMEAIRNDIALFLGISPDDVQITDIAPDSVARSSNTQVSLTLQGSSDTQTSAYQSSFQSAANSNSLSFPNTQQTYAQDFPHQDIGVSNVVVTQQALPGTSGASAVAVSALLVAAGVAAALI